MKTTLRRLLAATLVFTLLFTLSGAAFAAKTGKKAAPTAELQGTVVPVTVQMPFANVSLKVEETVDVTAAVTGEDEEATYKWYSTDVNVATVSGSGKDAKITAVAPGHASIALTVDTKDERSGFGSLEVTVTAASTPVAVSGGEPLTPEACEQKALSATVSGGSGSYEYCWETDGSGVVTISKTQDATAEIYAGRAGSGTVILTVFDAADHNNNASTTWNFTVKEKPLVAPEVTLSGSTLELDAGATGTLTLTATGGSGEYEYLWSSDNTGAVTVSGNGATAEIQTAAAVIPGSNKAEITASVRDKQSGLMSNTVACVVTVNAKTASYSANGSAEAGENAAFSSLAEQISAAFQQNFGSAVGDTASVRFTVTSSSVGAVCTADGTAVTSGTSYSFDTFRTFIFRADDAGEFSTSYTVSEGGKTLEGTISYTVTGGKPLISATLSRSAIEMPTFSYESLTLTLTPSLPCTVDWTTSDPYIVSLNPSGSKVRLETNCNSGTAIVTATVTDSTGKKTSCSCEVTVYSISTSAMSQTVTYDTYLTLSLGSDNDSTKLAESLISKFRTAFGVYPSYSDTIRFTSLGNSRFGAIYTRDGYVVSANRTYNYYDWADMYFTPSAAGTYIAEYRFGYGSRTAEGTIRITVQSSSLAIVMSQASLRMAAYSSQYLSVSVTPTTAYRVTWTSSNPGVANVTGNGTTAVVNSYANGTATITAVVTDSRGVETRRSCTVLVGADGTAFDPTITTALGSPVVNTDTSGSMRSQFANLYGVTPTDDALICFASTGNTDVAIMRLEDGSAIRANVNYTLGQYARMYTQPVSEGTYSIPYTLVYAGKTMSGTVSVIVSAASISTDIKLPSDGEYVFSDPIGASTGGKLFSESITNSIGSGWSYVRFGSVSGSVGTLYADRNRTPISASAGFTVDSMLRLCFVPGDLYGVFSAPYTVYSANGSVIATGTLNVVRSGASGFTDVPATSYYAQAVNWAVIKGITSGTAATLFSPDMIVTRGQAVTFLWRVAGQPKVQGVSNPFADVKAGAYYNDAVLWAVQQGITNGTSATTFSPDAQLNRDQLLTFLCRASGSYAEGANWSQLAVNWANAHGLLDGVPGTFSAASACPRSDVVYYLWKNYTA